MRRPQRYIDPTECIDWGACVPLLPGDGYFTLEELSETHTYTEISASEMMLRA